jgi:cell division septation protein DedD
MSSMETINEEIQPNPETPANTAQQQAKRVFIGIAATITVGLALAGWYLGGRIFETEKVHAAAITKPIALAPVAPAPIIVKSVEATPVVEPVTVAPVSAWDTVEPKTGDLYLQLATMGPNSTNEYLKTLDTKGIHPRVAPGPSESLHRLVIGPYPDKAALEKEQQELEAAGIQFMARRY